MIEPDRNIAVFSKASIFRPSSNGERAKNATTQAIHQRRGRGQQQITVKHVTVNADQAVATDQIVSGEAKDAGTAACGMEKPMEIKIKASSAGPPARNISMPLPGP